MNSLFYRYGREMSLNIGGCYKEMYGEARRLGNYD